MKTLLNAGTSLLAVTLAAGLLVGSQPAAAQDAAAIQTIQRQIQQLQAELRKLQADAAARDAALKQAQADAAAARAALATQKAAAAPAVSSLVVPPSAPPNSAVVTIPPNDKDASGAPVYNPNKPNGKFNLGGVTVTLGGFADLTGIYRSRDQGRGTSTSFSGVPFMNTADGNLSELRASAQQSRFSLLVEGKPDDSNAIAGYGEADFNNGAGGTTSAESNGYTPRLRQAYVQWDNSAYGVHALAGQTWSLATPFKVGITPRSEWQPQTIDSAYIAGYVYLRVPELRIAKEFSTPIGKTWLALAVDDPQTDSVGGTAPAIAGTPTLVTTESPGATGGGGLNPAASYSYSVAPDLILKAAADTAFGHYEVFGVARWFKDRVEFAATPNKNATNIITGGGIGANAYVPIVKNYLEFYGNILAGSGIGRYGAVQFPDVTYKADGSLAPLKEVMGTVGLVGHPISSLDLYAYYGLDQIDRKTGTLAGKGYGYGVPADNSGCAIELSAAGCATNTSRLSEVTLGAWWRFYTGSLGTVQTGIQFAHIERKLFGGTKGGAPKAEENMIYAGLRYYPFN